MADLTSTARAGTFFVIALLTITALKIFLAIILDLYSDEIFYWQASTRPAMAYSDLPFMTALMAGLGTGLIPHSTLGVRLLFLVQGAMIPLILYWVAKPVTGKRQALEAALLSLCIPLAGILGLLAVPDVPLIFFGLLSIGFFERALRTGRLQYWLMLGLVVACGFSTHYRYFLYVLGAVLFLLLIPEGRKYWKKPGLWAATAIGTLGLVPILLFNLNNDLSGLGYHLLDRHPWAFQASGFLHIFKQAGLVTPFLYLVLLATMWRMLVKTREQNIQAGLFLCIAATNIFVFVLLAPWADSTRTSIHWPLSGYLPLLVFVPETLRLIASSGERRFSKTATQKVVLAIPALGLIGTFCVMLGIGSQGFHSQLQPIVGPGILSNKMAGWDEFAAHTEQLIQQEDTPVTSLIITDNYYTSAQLEFHLGDKIKSYTLDQDKAVRDGRITQYALWQLDREGLSKEAGRDALFVSEDSTLTIPDKFDVLNSICAHAGNVEFLHQLNLLNGEKRFSFYRAENLEDPITGTVCPYPSRAWIDQPEPGAIVSGLYPVRGWAFNEDIGIAAIYLLINGQRYASAHYGEPREDVVSVMNVASDPNKPNLGYSIELDSTRYTNGTVTLALELHNTAGEIQVYGERVIEIDNP